MSGAGEGQELIRGMEIRVIDSHLDVVDADNPERSTYTALLAIHAADLRALLTADADPGLRSRLADQIDESIASGAIVFIIQGTPVSE